MSSRFIPARLLVVAGILVALAACGGGAANPTASAPASSATGKPAVSGSAEIAAKLPLDITIQTYRGADALGGESVLLSEVLAKGKPVAVNFFAGLCPPCRAEMPDLQEVYDAHADRFILIGVDIGPFTGLGSNSDGLQLIEDLNVTFPTGSTRDRELVRQFKVLGMPSTTFIKPDGTILRKWDGALTRGKMEELVLQLVEASK